MTEPRWCQCLVAGLGAVVLAACALVPERSPAPATHDFGPPPAIADAPAWRIGGIWVAAVDAPPWLDGTEIRYRLLHDRPTELRAYATHRWVAPPAVLLRERLRARLGDAQRPGPRRAADATQMRYHLRLELEEFEQRFQDETTSEAVVMVHATLVDQRSGEAVASRAFRARAATPADDAAAGIAALARLADEVVGDLVPWAVEAVQP